MNILTNAMIVLAQAGVDGANSASDPSIANRVAGLTIDPLHVLVGGLSRLDILNYPKDLINTLSQFHVVWAAILLVLGLIAITNGYVWRSWIVMIIAFLLGIELGGWASQSMAVSGVVAGSVGLLIAIIAYPMMKHAITICGALAGAFVGANAWTAMGQPPDAYLAGALIGFILFGMMAFLAHNIVTVMMTCIVGSVMMVLGGLALMLQVPGWEEGLGNSLQANTVVIPLITLVIAVFGFVIQQGAVSSAPAKQQKGEAKPAPA